MRVDIRDGIAPKAVKKVLVNGKEVLGATIADTEMGFVEHYKTNDKGEFLTIGGALCKTITTGVVDIEFHSHWEMNSDGNYVRKYSGKQQIFNNPYKKAQHVA